MSEQTSDANVITCVICRKTLPEAVFMNHIHLGIPRVKWFGKPYPRD